MKFKGAIRMLMVLICASALMQISMSDEAHAGYVKEDILYTPDDTLSTIRNIGGKILHL